MASVLSCQRFAHLTHSTSYNTLSYLHPLITYLPTTLIKTPFVSKEFRSSTTQRAVVFWNAIVSFRLRGLPYAFLLAPVEDIDKAFPLRSLSPNATTAVTGSSTTTLTVTSGAGGGIHPNKTTGLSS